MFISFILSALVLLATSQKSLILIDYQLNRAHYEESCVNKDKPQMHCHGQCKMRKEVEKKESQTQFVKINLEVNMLPQKLIEIPTRKIWLSEDEKSGFQNYSEKLLEGIRYRLLNPPRDWAQA